MNIMMRYEGFAVSERGYQHILNDTVRQDNVQYVQDPCCVVISVADGHGSQSYFRSDRGSLFASRIACSKIRDFLYNTYFPFQDKKEEKRAVTQLVHSIITEWHIAVRQNLLKNPFTEDEMKLVPEKYAAEYKMFTKENTSKYTDRELIEKMRTEVSNIQKAYGTTLIAVGICDKYAIGLHIGDGKCISLYEDGTMDEPIPWDTNCYLNRCTSICDRNAVEEFRYNIWQDELPIAIFIGTDGIDDTFAAMLHPFYRNIALDFIQNDFRDYVGELQKKLSDISRNGSRDDVSIAGILHMPRLRNVSGRLKLITRLEQNQSRQKNLTEQIVELKFRLEKTQRLIERYSSLENSEDALKEQLKKKAEQEAKLLALQERLEVTEKEIMQLNREMQPEERLSDPEASDESGSSDEPERKMHTDPDVSATAYVSQKVQLKNEPEPIVEDGKDAEEWST